MSDIDKKEKKSKKEKEPKKEKKKSKKEKKPEEEEEEPQVEKETKMEKVELDPEVMGLPPDILKKLQEDDNFDINDSFDSSREQIAQMKGTVKLKEDKKKKNLKHMLARNITLKNLGTQAPLKDESDAPTWAAERECLMLLLHSRILLKNLIQIKRKNERIKRGDLNIQEVQAFVQSQKEDSETDWIAEIQEIKRNVLNEVRQNHKLETELSGLDKKISLLIKNKSQIQELIVQKKGRALSLSTTNEISSDPKKLDAYANLFYLLQTNPKYLANLLYLIASDQMKEDSFMETVILTLYGDVFSPREEYLLLSLFGLSIRKEMNTFKQALDFLNKGDSVVPKMIQTYNKRKAGLVFVTNVIKPVIKSIVDASNKKKIDVDLKPRNMFNKWLNEYEVKTGEKSKYDRNMPDEDILKLPEIQEQVKEKLDLQVKWSQELFQAIVKNVHKIPYGIRWICKEIKSITTDIFPQTSPTEVFKIMAYFVFFKYLNITIVSPVEYGLVEESAMAKTPVTTKNLVQVAKILQYQFSLNTFTEVEHKPLNALFEEKKELVTDFFNELIKVSDPEEHLQVDKYMEFTQKTKPIIIISLREISLTHGIISKNIEKIADAKDKDDPLRIIINELGKVPEISNEDNREIQLTLQNRLSTNIEAPDPNQAKYVETKELIINSFKSLPEQSTGSKINLREALQNGLKYAQDNNEKALKETLQKILKNMDVLEKAELINPSDDYKDFMKDIALEAVNRAQVRELQKKELKRLKGTLENLRKHQKYLKDQINYWEEYLQNVRGKQTGTSKKAPKKKKENKGTITHKFTYEKLQKKGVILNSEVPTAVRKKTTFIISTSKIGIFEIDCRIAGASVEKITIELDDLLERNFNNITQLILPQVILDVNLTIHLINEFFLK